MQILQGSVEKLWKLLIIIAQPETIVDRDSDLV
jgi:hypothetical protein